MKITVFGSGYVGLVTGACLADRGNYVVFVDTDEERIQLLNSGKSPIFEPGLEDLLADGSKAGRLSFTTDARQGVEHGEIIFIAVGTPQSDDGSANLDYVMQVAESIGQHIGEYKVVATKSTVPVGTSRKIIKSIDDQLKQRNTDIDFDVASNPEFLKEGAAVQGFTRPDRVIIGVASERAETKLRSLYAPGQRRTERIISMDTESAETTLEGADVLAVVTEWNLFRNPDFELISQKLSKKMIFDGRNIYNPTPMANQGLGYFGIGRNNA